MLKYIIALLFLSNSLLAQEAMSSTAVSSTSIKANFSAQSLEAYKESSFSKITDFYEYLQTYSDPASTDDLKTQVKAAIASLFLNKDIQVLDVTSPSLQLISIDQLLEKINRHSFKFEVKNNQNNAVYNNYWLNSYTLEVRNTTALQTFKINQKVYFFPLQKQFGTAKKTVWSVQLGEMQ